MPSISFEKNKLLLKKIEKELYMFNKILWTNDTSSTNLDLLNMIKNKNVELPCLIGTNHQYAGKGRQGKSWLSNNDLMFSCGFKIRIPSFNLSSIAIVAGISACESLKKIAGNKGLELNLKWPNDIQWKEKKLSGILVETIKDKKENNIHNIVLGIGVNLNDALYKSQILHRSVADWSEITNNIKPEQIVKIITTICISWYKDMYLLQNYGLKIFYDRFNRIDFLFGKRINVEENGIKTQNGIAEGINELGHLTIKTMSGKESVYFGNVSINCKNDHFN
ncbi:BirA family transcriptional regulator, biotin operon repressor [Candidatus Kinetoplastibacterium desouzaii TCC079E]|uniref:biotin--[biotin carboxyl-carrier protein] ligase n=1 Tax=Candidatus Kinetoplastidibacterium desouzai TCC079E TaxID=1208919 RepID=M1LVH4_9PROT|nr:biotin--[acetyl-CoA-carboxylase] ligase [Candidatus Kinetoplastibacterium desouzaii]AGF47239.1 BirA family transcriptional regulator, biotin operon repressor [Candidatus Kinetoplastibacterium desouzaii TCC079E]